MSLTKIINALLIIDIGIVIFTYLSGNRVWFINSQIGFISSTLVVFASFISYRNMVNRRLESGAIADLERDTIDKIEDPHSLYGGKEEESINKVDIKRVSTLEALKSSRATLSLYRIGAYIVLILGFFYLNRTHQLDIIPYISSLSIPPVLIILFLFKSLK